MEDPLMFRMVPDFHGIDCAIDFDIAPAMLTISPEDFENAFLSEGYFLDMNDEGSETRDGIKEYSDEPPDTPYRDGECGVCGESWYADEGHEIVSVDGRDDVFMWFDRNRPDLVERGLISGDHGKRLPFLTRTVINRVLR